MGFLRYLQRVYGGGWVHVNETKNTDTGKEMLKLIIANKGWYGVRQREKGWPIPALYDQPPTYSWCNYTHYAQYRTNPRSDFHSRPKMNNSSKRNANRQSYVWFSTQMRTWHILLIKSDLKWCIHLSRFTMTLRTVLVQYIEFFVVVCNFDDFVDRLVYFVGKNYRNYQVSF